MVRTLFSLSVLSLLASCNCELVECMRHSDCPQEQVCGAGVCGVPLSADTDTDAVGSTDTDGDTDGSSGSGGSTSSGGSSSSDSDG